MKERSILKIQQKRVLFETRSFSRDPPKKTRDIIANFSSSNFIFSTLELGREVTDSDFGVAPMKVAAQTFGRHAMLLRIIIHFGLTISFFTNQPCFCTSTSLKKKCIKKSRSAFISGSIPKCEKGPRQTFETKR